MLTYIHEFPHPRLVLCYDHPPHTDVGPDSLDWFGWAMDRGVSCLELHLRWRERDQAVVSAHDQDEVSEASPTFKEVMELILARKGQKPTVYPDGKQFFLVLEIMDPSDPVTDNLYSLLFQFQGYLSTAAQPDGQPRPLTLLLTGGTDRFYDTYKTEGLNRLALKEEVLYTDDEIRNLSDPWAPFRWTLFEDDDERGGVNARHRDKQANVRVWYGEDDRDANEIRAILATGADAQNTRNLDLESSLWVLAHQIPRGKSPALAARGAAALVTWASDHNYLYAAVGTVVGSSLVFPRQLNLTEFLSGEPQTFAPAAALSPDKETLVIAYEGVSGEGALWYIAGQFTSADRFITFAGGQTKLSIDDDQRRIGHNPSVAVGRGGRVIVVYETSGDDESLYYVSGFLNDEFVIEGDEHVLRNEHGVRVRGYTPAVAIDAKSNILVIYRGTSDEKLWYVTGVIATSGQIVDCREHCLTQGERRRGYRPSVAIRDDGFVAITYEGTTAPRLWYVTGHRDGSGEVTGNEFELSQTDPTTGTWTRIGTRPTVTFGEANQGVILYEGTSGGKLWYVLGNWSEQGALDGDETQLNMVLDKS